MIIVTGIVIDGVGVCETAGVGDIIVSVGLTLGTTDC